MRFRSYLPLLLIGLFGALLLFALRSNKTEGPNARAVSDEATHRAKLQREDLLFSEERRKELVAQDLKFSQWNEQWSQVNSNFKRTQLLETGKRLAAARASQMRDLIRQDPDLALEMALTYSEYAALPEEVKKMVEEPFSDSGSVEVMTLCDEQATHYRLEYGNGDAYALFMPSKHRLASSKKSIPLQGIRLDGVAVVRPTVFQVLDHADVDFVRENWSMGQADSNRDYSSGEQIEGGGLTAVAGGHVFHFQDEDSLALVENALSKADSKPANDVSSQWILTQVSGDGFPFEAFSEEMVSANYDSSTGAKTALIIMVNFQDVVAPANQAVLEQVVDVNVSNALAEYSYFTTSMDATVYGSVVTISSNAAAYLNDPNDGNPATKDYNHLYNEAIAEYLANEGGGTPDPRTVYDTVCMYFGNAGFSWAGLASVGGQRMWLENTTSDEVILHEFGHNYGLRHANYWAYDNSNDSSTDPVDPTGASDEYGDDFDVMGDGSTEEGHFHMGAKQSLGWIGESDWQDLSGSGDSGTYRIYRFDSPSATGNQALRISKSATGDHYWVGYRKEYASLASFEKGAYLTWERAAGSTSRNQTWLVDTTPQSSGGKNDAPITLGRTYSDTASEVHITPVAAGGAAPNEYLDVVVNFGSFAGNTTPTGTIHGPSSTSARQLEQFSVAAIDGDGDVLAYAWDMGDGVIQENSSSITHSWVSGGTYTVSVTVTDLKGGSVSLSKEVTVVDPLNTWATRTSGTSLDLYGLAANSSHVIAVGDDGLILRSADGDTWDDSSPAGFVTNVRFFDAVWTGSEFVVAGRDYDFDLGGWVGVIYSSSDGVTWTRDYKSSSTGSELEGIAYDESSVLVAVGENGGVVRKSGAGAWSAVNAGVAASTDLRDVAYGDGVFVMVGHNNASDAYNGDVVVKTSSDGLSWADYSSGTGLSSWQDFRTVEYVNGGFHAGGFYGRARRSTDAAQTWSTTQTSDGHQITGFAYTNGLYYGVGRDRRSSNVDVDILSADGVTWETRQLSAMSDRNDIVVFKNTFITVGESGSIRQSGSAAAGGTYLDFADTYFPGGGAQALSTANGDEDWANNFIEYALGGDPTDINSVAVRPTLSVNGSGFPVFEVTRSAKQSDVAYSVWRSTNLVDWTQSNLTIELDDATTLRVSSSIPADDEEKVFFKLNLSQ